MEDGGLVLLTAPDNPYRCPPGPYERASLIAYYLKTHKPRSKLMLLDAKDTFTKQVLFRAAWARLYPGVLEWVSGSQGGRVVRVDVRTGTVHTDFDEYKPAVANIVPPQRAAAIARAAGLDDGDLEGRRRGTVRGPQALLDLARLRQGQRRAARADADFPCLQACVSGC